MTHKKIIQSGVGIVAATAVMLSFASFAFAQSGTSVSASATTSVSTKKPAAAAKLSAKQKLNESSLVNKSNAAIDKRVEDLNYLSEKISGMKNVSDAEKSSLTGSISEEVSKLNDLKAKIGTDTDMTSLQADAKSITADNRVYALVVPQARISSANDKAITVINMITAMVPKLQQRITEAQTAGKDVTALNATLSDLNAKLADATSLSGSIPAGVSSLTPDQGNKTALKAARKNLAIIESDLAAARKDVSKITAGVKGVGPSASITSTTNATTTTGTTTR